MNLTSLFNFNYLKENFKKSKAVILLCIFLIPIINLITYLMQTSKGINFMPTFAELSRFLIVGMYVLPFVLSLTLFGFVYRRQSSDFVMSMPLSKKQIFLTNTIGGIVVILLMILINVLFTGVVSFVFPNIFLDYKMLWDLFLIWFTSYVFVFTCSNIAMSLSGNKITTFVLFLLVLFLIPFVHTFIYSPVFRTNNDMKVICEDDKCTPKDYYCNDISCQINQKNGIYDVSYEKVYNVSYTLPYEVIKNFLFSGSSLKVSISVIKMTVLSILYIIIGTLLFNFRKFEIVSTSFKSENVHLFVRSLTLIPFVCIGYVILSSEYRQYDLFTILFLFVVVATYLIIYDLITRKKIVKFWKSALHLVVTIFIVSLVGVILDNKDTVLEVTNINSLSIDSEAFNGYIISEGKIEDREFINYIMAIFLDNKALDDHTKYRYLRANVYTKSNDEYSFGISVNEEQYKYIMSKISNDENYKRTSKYIDKKDVFAIGLYNQTMYIDSDSELYKELTKKLDDDYRKINSNSLFNVTMFVYDDYVVKEVSISIDDDKELCEKILNLFNAETKRATLSDNFDIDYYYIDEAYHVYNGSAIYYKLNEFVINNASERVDINSDYKVIVLRSYSNKNSHVLITNKVRELDDIIRSLGDNDEESTY